MPVPEIFGPQPTGHRPPGWRYDKNNPDILISSSPLNITWSDATHMMVLDPDSNSLCGFLPVKVFPQYEADTQTWGMIWMNTGTDAYCLTLQASQDGWGLLSAASCWLAADEVLRPCPRHKSRWRRRAGPRCQFHPP